MRPKQACWTVLFVLFAVNVIDSAEGTLLVTNSMASNNTCNLISGETTSFIVLMTFLFSRSGEDLSPSGGSSLSHRRSTGTDIQHV